ncbi:MAG: MATE family efflux transporter [Eubacterium sp.]|nr:MATE family efflux transporter [Eubacterium sp.]
MAMISMLSDAVINVGLDAWFMYGLELGIKGAAWATIIGQGISFIISLACIFKLKNVHLTKNCFKMKSSTIGRVCGIGVSSFITQAEIVILTIVMNNVLVKYSAQSVYGEDIPMTTIGIAMKVNSVLTNIIAGIAIGGQPIISFNYGAKQYGRVKETYKTCVIAAIIVSAIAFFCFQIIPEYISGIFGNEGELYTNFACKAFRICLMLVISVAIANVSGIFIPSIGKPVKSSILTLARQVICQCPAILIFAAIGGVEAALWAGPATDEIAFIMAVAFMIYEFKAIKTVASDANDTAVPQEVREG